MEHTVNAYLQRLPKERLEKFLQDYKDGKLTEDFSGVIDEVMDELVRRKEDIS